MSGNSNWSMQASRVLGLFPGGIVQGRHVLAPADPFEFGVLVVDVQPCEFFPALLGSGRVAGYRGVPLADVSRVGKDPADGLHLAFVQTVHLLKLLE